MDKLDSGLSGIILLIIGTFYVFWNLRKNMPKNKNNFTKSDYVISLVLSFSFILWGLVLLVKQYL